MVDRELRRRALERYMRADAAGELSPRTPRPPAPPARLPSASAGGRDFIEMLGAADDQSPAPQEAARAETPAAPRDHAATRAEEERADPRASATDSEHVETPGGTTVPAEMHASPAGAPAPAAPALTPEEVAVIATLAPQVASAAVSTPGTPSTLMTQVIVEGEAAAELAAELSAASDGADDVADLPDLPTLMSAAASSAESAATPDALRAALPRLAAGIVNAARELRAGESTALQVLLDPPSLGRLEITLQRSAGVLTIEIHAERRETAAMLGNIAGALERVVRSQTDVPVVALTIPGYSGGQHGRGDEQRRDRDEVEAARGTEAAPSFEALLGPLLGASFRR